MIQFNNIRRILSHGRKAVEDYGMIAEGDRIAVGLSGGKDSIALLCMLYNMRLFYPKRYELCAVTVDMGFGIDFEPLIKFCAELEIEYRIINTQLAKLIFETRKESNPCSLCSRMRRGILHDAVVAMNCNKLALGHHFDDVVETFMLNLFNEGRIGAFSPVTYLSRKNITMIRPLIYVREKEIRYFIKRNPSLPLIKNPCPEDENTDRENIKLLLDKLERENKGLKHRIFGAMQKADVDGFGIMNNSDSV